MVVFTEIIDTNRIYLENNNITILPVIIKNIFTKKRKFTLYIYKRK